MGQPTATRVRQVAGECSMGDGRKISVIRILVLQAGRSLRAPKQDWSGQKNGDTRMHRHFNLIFLDINAAP